MADLNWLEQRRIEEFFSSNDWFATHNNLTELFRTYKQDQHDFLDDGSKRDRIRSMLINCPNLVAASILLDLLENGCVKNKIYPWDWMNDYKECKKILESLKLRDEGPPQVELAKTHFQKQKESLLKDWNDANLGIWISMYLFNDQDLADKLLIKYQEGLTIMLILQEDEQNHKLQESHWDKMPCSVWWYQNKMHGRGGINHRKFCIIDGQILWHGSYNFTWSASNLNEEEFTRNTNIPNVREFSEEFTRLRHKIDEEGRARKLIT
ncbi:phospholipase D-like domain-containing protein [Synechococcus sp. MIT S1220]|uniref:phospholipase D-like domain-containing protein n=1 Tax=Synechococcus sp. MIT S1220 TaxID=3082549 RepID=UPI0039AEE4A1